MILRGAAFHVSARTSASVQQTDAMQKPMASNLHRERDSRHKRSAKISSTSTAEIRQEKFDKAIAEAALDPEAMLAFGIDPNDERLQPPPKKAKKKSKKPEKIIPPVPTFEEALELMERRFVEIEKEHLGPKRGVGTVKKLVGKKGEKLHKTVTTKMANTILNDWIYTRHAMKHGFRHLTEMTKKELSASLIRPGTTVKFDERDARLSLKELFRHGYSSILEKYHALDRKRDLTVQEIDTDFSNNRARRKTLADLGYTPVQIAKEDGILVQRAIRRGLLPKPNEGELLEGLPPPAVEVNTAVSAAGETSAQATNTTSPVPQQQQQHRIRSLKDRVQMEAAGYTAEEIDREEYARYQHGLKRAEKIQSLVIKYASKKAKPSSQPNAHNTPIPSSGATHETTLSTTSTNIDATDLNPVN
jgi:hypothetical protein